MIRRPPRSTLSSSSAASDVYKRQVSTQSTGTSRDFRMAGSNGAGDLPGLNINVGVLGHVDSGKTSLVRSLSTIVSTAGLDKHKQSQDRGITLDLGFSSFVMDAPEQIVDAFPGCDKVQYTLVDCPGHASLIKTVIGGAQILSLIHISEPTRLLSISYAVFCLKKKKKITDKEKKKKHKNKKFNTI
eukprot:TRINITY_DN12224_c0_g1_i3.p2 TRINITY_DN12224_c0_g1~~TRINITY_DN12224_c0_g1_i3.p2  ORF type:complete len:186 (+),score=49.65 TRINITY_DN12224_c0_g1_i3:119-676(+)